MSKMKNFQKIYPLSPMQQRMLFHYLRDRESNVAFEQAEMQIKGPLDITLFEKSFNQLLQRYDILRTNIVYQKIKVPRQVVFKEKKEQVYFEDRSDLPDTEKSTYIKEFKAKDMARGFDLTKDTLIRVSIIKTDEDTYQVIWSHHHIIMDGWCIGIIFQDFLQIYLALKQGQPLNLSKVYPYSDYIEWLEKQDQDEAKTYWEKYLHEYQLQAFPLGYNGGSPKGAYQRQTNRFTFDLELTKGLEKIANECNVTVNTVFQAIWGLLLQRYNNTEDVVFGAVVSGRPPHIEGIEQMLGIFINTIPVRIKSAGDQPFIDLVKSLQEDVLSSTSYEYYPLPEIQYLTPLKGDLINNIIIFENYPLDDQALNSTSQDIGFEVSSKESFSQTNYNFSIFVTPGKELDVNMIYNGHVYRAEDVQQMESHIKTIAQAVVENSQIGVNAIEIFSPEERESLLIQLEERLKPRNLREEPNLEYVAPTNHVQQKMVYIWEEVLGVEGVGITHSFFDIGGNSINILRLLQLTNDEFDVNISASELFLNPTIAELAESIYQDSELNQLEFVVRLNKIAEDKKNVFMIHGPDGSGYLYKELASYLQGECNLYGIQAKGLFDPTQMADSVDEMVDDYLKEIRLVQPEGPYIIGGYCFGTRIMYELVRRLEEAGELVEKMVAVDELAFFNDRLAKLLKMRAKTLKPVLGMQKALKKDATLPAISSFLNKMIQPESEFVPKEERTVREHISHLCLREYPLRDIVKAPTFVIKAEDTDNPKLSKEHWRCMTHGSVELYEIPGDHWNIFADPYVEGLAGAMRKVLNAELVK